MQQVVHLDDNVLEQYAMNRLSVAEAELVEDHILLCGSCLDRLDEAVVFLRDMKSVLERDQAAQRAPEKPASSLWDWLGWKTPVWAGAAFAMALLVFFVFREQPAANFATVVLTATRGASTAVHGTGPFDFELFVPEAADSYRAVLVDSEGRELWSSVIGGSDAKGTDGKVHAMVRQKLAPGQYFLRVSDPSSRSLHEYGIRIDR